MYTLSRLVSPPQKSPKGKKPNRGPKILGKAE